MPHLTCSLFQSPSLLSFSRFHFVSLRFPHSLGLPVSLTAMCCMQICYCVCPCFVWVVWAGTAGHGGSVACTAASQQEGHGFDSRMGCCWLWGSGPGGLSPRPFCVKFACFPRVHRGFPPLRTPTEKTCKRTEHSSSVPDQDRRFTSPGPRALKSCPLLLGSCVCVCVCAVYSVSVHSCLALEEAGSQFPSDSKSVLPTPL